MQIHHIQNFDALNIIQEYPLKIIYSNGGIICGGLARHLATLNEDSEWKDVDIFFENEESLKKTINILTKFYGIVSVYKSKYSGIEVDNMLVSKKLKFQLIHQEGAKNFESVLKKFDFTVCQAYYDYYNNRVITSDIWKQHEDARLLRWAGVGELHVYRLSKYISKGYLPNYDLIVRTITNEKNPAEALSFLYYNIYELYRQKDPSKILNKNVEDEFALLKQIKSLSILLEKNK